MERSGYRNNLNKNNANKNYIRGRNELYDNLPPAESFQGGMALIHLYKRDIERYKIDYDDYWLNVVCDEDNKNKFLRGLREINRIRKADIKEIIKKGWPPEVLLNLYYNELAKHKMRFFIGNPKHYKQWGFDK
jgi:hypothetical protein